MSVLALVGAGPGLGQAVAQRFGREGFTVALIARNTEKLAAMERELAAEGVTAKGYAADVQDHAALTQALEKATGELGPIDVLEFSPVPAAQFLKPVCETTVEDLQAAAQFSLLGFAAAARHVLPGMTERGSGTILLVNGSSAATANLKVAGTSAAFAAQSAYGVMLHEAVAEFGVSVRQLIIPGAIGGGDPQYAPEALAEHIWTLHTTPGAFRVTVGDDTP